MAIGTRDIHGPRHPAAARTASSGGGVETGAVDPGRLPAVDRTVEPPHRADGRLHRGATGADRRAPVSGGVPLRSLLGPFCGKRAARRSSRPCGFAFARESSASTDLLLVADATDPRRRNRFWTGADVVVEVVSPDQPERTCMEGGRLCRGRDPRVLDRRPEIRRRDGPRSGRRGLCRARRLHPGVCAPDRALLARLSRSRRTRSSTRRSDRPDEAR